MPPTHAIVIVNFETITLFMLVRRMHRENEQPTIISKAFFGCSASLVDEMCGRTSRDVHQMVREVCQTVCISCARRPTTHFRRPDGVQLVYVDVVRCTILMCRPVHGFGRPDGHFLVAQVVTSWPPRWSFFRLFDVFFVDF